MKSLNLKEMEVVEGGSATCGNSFFMALTGAGVVLGLFSGGDLMAYHKKIYHCITD